MNLELYDAVEVQPVRRELLHGLEYFETTKPDAPNVHCWSVYLHLREGGVECVADCPDQATAALVANALENQLKEITA